MNPHFEQLKRDLLGEPAAATTDVPDDSGTGTPPALSITVDDVPVMLAAHASEERVAILCADCGEIPEHQATEVMSTVLGASLALYRDLGATFCVNPITRNLLVLARIRLDETPASRVVEIARQFAAAVHRFDEDHFASDAPSWQPDDRAAAQAFARI